MAGQYGQPIAFPALRHDIIAFTGFMMRDDHQSIRDHVAQSQRALLRIPATITDADLFGACLLAYVAFHINSSPSEILARVNGCLAILRHLSKKPASDMLSAFGHFVYDSVNEIAIYSALMSSHDLNFQLRRSTYHQRIKYWTEFRRFYDSSHPYGSVILNEVLDTLGTVFVTLIRSIRRVALREVAKYYQREKQVECAIRCMAKQLNEPDFQRVLTAIQMSSAGRRGPRQEDAVTLSFVLLKSAYLASMPQLSGKALQVKRPWVYHAI